MLMELKKKKLSLKKNNTLLRYVFKSLSYLKIILLFVLLWVFFSGNPDPLLIVCGIIAVILTFIFCIIGKVASPDSYIIKLGFFKYVYVLIKDVIVSSIQMVRIIYSEKLNINPGTITLNVGNLTDQEKVLFSNLITMTPGTFVIAIEGDNFLIHALNKDDLEFKDNKEITQLIKKMRENSEENNKLEDNKENLKINKKLYI